MFRELHPHGPVHRAPGGREGHTRDFIVPGPNFLWSIDGHCKLQHWGFHIYCGIDAYARYVPWVYVGIDAATPVSILKQYLDTAEATGIVPQFLRADRGSETPMCADAHYNINCELRGDGICLGECFIFGTSTANQRIEAWWRQISKSWLYRWRVVLLII